MEQWGESEGSPEAVLYASLPPGGMRCTGLLPLLGEKVMNWKPWHIASSPLMADQFRELDLLSLGWFLREWVWLQCHTRTFSARAAFEKGLSKVDGSECTG